MVQCLRVLVLLREDEDSAPVCYLITDCNSSSSVLLTSVGTRHKRSVHTYMRAKHTHEINMLTIFKLHLLSLRGHLSALARVGPLLSLEVSLSQE